MFALHNNKLVGLTRSPGVALRYVLADPVSRSAHFFQDPYEDEISCIDDVLDANALSQLSNETIQEVLGYDPSGERTISSSEPYVVDESSGDESIDGNNSVDFNEPDASVPPAPFVVEADFRQGLTGDPVDFIIKLCEELHRFCDSAVCDQDKDTITRHADSVISVFSEHLIASTTPILKRFILNLPRRGKLSALVLLLLQGAIDTLDELQAKHDGDRHITETVAQLIRRLREQVSAIHVAALQVSDEDDES